MYGRRGRIGLIVPASNTVCEPEMAKLCPRDVATYSTRILFTPTIKGLKDMKAHIERASEELSSEGICRLIAFCCTVGSMIGGVGYDEEIIQAIEERAGIPAITTTTAIRAALSALGIKRLAVATPYTAEINNIERSLLNDMGYEVTGIVGYHENVRPQDLKNDMIGRLSPEVALELGRAVNGPENDALFISCTNFRSIEIIERLEIETGKPVISSNQVTMWHSLRKMGIDDRINGLGRLFDSL
ncbi:MAG: aspartate/glutamate racemase family protein [Deltaproteobacteria bacterium]|nr:aspartate/glutamate racemase family protein [Deltaproteobacteria bacterium]